MVAIEEHPRERDEGKVAGMGEAMRQAELGLKLFQAEVEKDYDLPGAFKFKEQQDAKIKALEAEADSLHGKDNMKARAAKGTEAAAVKAAPQYLDACKVVKGLETKHGFFVKSADAPMEEKPVEEIVAEEEKEAKKREKKDDKKTKEGRERRIEPCGDEGTGNFEERSHFAQGPIEGRGFERRPAEQGPPSCGMGEANERVEGKAGSRMHTEREKRRQEEKLQGIVDNRGSEGV
jgi:hypothetical protein